MRVTLQIMLVAAELLSGDPQQLRWGAEVGERVGLLPGTVYPILQRMREVEWLTDTWEDIDPQAEGRPARRLFQLTEKGRAEVTAMLARRGGRFASLRVPEPPSSP